MDLCPHVEFIDRLQRQYEKLQTDVRQEHDALTMEYPTLSRILYLPVAPTFTIRVIVGLALFLPSLVAYLLTLHWVGVALWCIIGIFSAPWSLISRIDAIWDKCQTAVKVYYALNFSSVLYAALVSASKIVRREWIEEQLDELRGDFTQRCASTPITNQSLFC